MNRNVVLIASYPKSGNTWTRALLTSILRDGADVRINNLMVATLPSRRVIDSALGVRSADLPDDLTIGLRAAVYRQVSKDAGSTARLFFKTHDTLSHDETGAYSPIFPENIDSVLYLVRDPRDVAPSLARHASVSIDEAIDRMADASHTLCAYPWRPGLQVPHLISSWSRHVESWTQASSIADRVHVFRYEDLVSQPEQTFGEMLNAIRMACDHAAISSAIDATRLAVLRQKEDRQGFAERPPQSSRFFGEGRVNGWVLTLRQDQVARIEHDHGDVMRRFRYLPFDEIARSV